MDPPWDWFRRGASTEFYVALALLGGLIGCAIAWAKSLKPGPHVGMEDARAMSEPAFKEFLEMCVKEEYEPALAWFAMIGGQFDEKVPVIPLPHREELGPS